MVRDAFRFVIPLLVLAAGSYTVYPPAAAIFLLLAAFTAFFFRNPARSIPPGENLVVSPADGKVVKIVEDLETEGGQGRVTVSIFLNIFDVHVNRAPVGGVLEKLEYRRGRFKAAFDDEASRVNEQNVLWIRADSGRIVVRQIAGLIARRVVCWKREGEPLLRGELIGLIRFGSRVDISLPGPVSLRVKTGDRVKGGSSIIGEYS